MDTVKNTLLPIELISAEVQQHRKEKRERCWEHNVVEEFPVESIIENNGKAVIYVGMPQHMQNIITSFGNSKGADHQN